MYSRRRFDHITSLLRDKLFLLCLPQKIDFKRCLLVFKALHGLVPTYIADYCININNNERRSRLRSEHNRLMIPRPSNTIRLGECSFSLNGPSLWNSLQNSVTDTRFIFFKTRLTRKPSIEAGIRQNAICYST